MMTRVGPIPNGGAFPAWLPERALAGVLRPSDGELVVRLVAAAVGHHQLLVGRLGRRDHLLAVLGRGVGHRLLAQHVLAGLERADRVLGVHAVGQHDVDGLDVRVVGDLVEVLVVVDVLRIDAVDLREPRRLLRAAADEGDDLRLLALREGREDLVGGQPADPDERPSHLLPGDFGQPDVGHLGRGGGDGAEERRGRERATGRLQEPPPGIVRVVDVSHGARCYSVPWPAVSPGPARCRGGPAVTRIRGPRCSLR